MQIDELVLRYLSRSPLEDGFDSEKSNVSNDPLSLLRREYPEFSQMVKGKNVVDFGCGNGMQSIALLREEGCNVCAIDTNTSVLTEAKKHASYFGINNTKLNFYEKIPDILHGTFDIVISQNAMEHFPDPVAVLRKMKSLIHSEGKILVTFGPPWFAPYGSHMHFFCKIPWINILFSEKAVMNVRALFRYDGAKKYEEVESGLNKMTLKKFKKIVADVGLDVEDIKYRVVKNQNWMVQIPLVKELVVNHVTSILVSRKQ